MARHVIETPFGEVWLHGERAPSPSGGPVLLAITGAFANDKQAPFQLQPHMPGIDVFAAHLPGNRCPALSCASVDVWGAAYAEAARVAFGDRPLTVLGESTGCLVALGMRPKRLVLLEPPLTSESVAPLVPSFRARAHDLASLDFISGIFGITPTTVEPRDYRHLLRELAGPALVVCGDRDVTDRLPSLVGDDVRAALRFNPLVRYVFIRGAGHDLFPGNGGTLVRLIREWASPSALSADTARSTSQPR